MKTFRASLLFLSLVATAAGCGYYSFSGSLPGHIKTAAVPLFENETTEPQIVEELRLRSRASTEAHCANESGQRSFFFGLRVPAWQK